MYSTCVANRHYYCKEQLASKKDSHSRVQKDTFLVQDSTDGSFVNCFGSAILITYTSSLARPNDVKYLSSIMASGRFSGWSIEAIFYTCTLNISHMRTVTSRVAM